MQDLRERQLQYELDSDVEAQAERFAATIKASAEGDLTLPRAEVLVSRMSVAVADELKLIAGVKTRGVGGKYKAWLRALDPEIAATIAVRECIKHCARWGSSKLAELVSSIGSLWELEVRISQADAINPVYLRKVTEQIKERGTVNLRHIRNVYNTAISRIVKGNIDLDLGQADMAHIGKFGVDACINAGLIQRDDSVSRLKSVHIILAPDVKDFLYSYTSSDFANTIARQETRMMCPPEPWTNLNDGGYLSLRRKVAAPLLDVRYLRKGAREDVVQNFTADKMPMVFGAANYLQSVAYTMHGATREAILRVWKSGGGTMGVPRQNPPEAPAFPYGPDWVREGATEQELDIFTQWKRKMVAYHEGMKKWRGHCREVSSFLRASAAVGSPMWFPVYFDSRGRWYYRGVPNPQGSDMAKGALHFHERKPLGKRGLFWLRVHIANSYGYDKERMVDRAQWTIDNWESISRALDEPENHPDVWGTDAPWCMFAAAWELREALRTHSPESYCTGVPVHMDATCSGLQHYSALLRDPEGGMYVNLYDDAMVGPKQDIYSRVASNSMKLIRLDAEGGDPEKCAMAAWALKFGISRNMAKKPVMTYVYSATVTGTAFHIESVMLEELREVNQVFPEDLSSYKVAMYLAGKLFEGIATVVPSADSAMRWLKSVAGQQPSGKRMVWTTPTGFKVQHDYQDYEEVRVSIRSCGVDRLTLRKWLTGTRKHSMRNAISPNFIHAMDASHLTLTALRMRDDNCSFVGIHDSFGTHPCDVDAMHKHIRESFVGLYSNRNILGDFLWEVGGVGTQPPQGTLDLSRVLSSEFMFS